MDNYKKWIHIMTKKVIVSKSGDFKAAENINKKYPLYKKLCWGSFVIAILGVVGFDLLFAPPLPKKQPLFELPVTKQKTLQEEFQATMQDMARKPETAEKLQVGEDISLPNRKGMAAKIIGTNTTEEGKPACVYHLSIKGKTVVVFLPGNCPQPN